MDANEKDEEGPLAHLPDNILLQIFAWLSPFTLIWMHELSRRFRRFCVDSDALWCAIYQSWRTHGTEHPKTDGSGTAYHRVVVQHLKIFQMLKLGLMEIGGAGIWLGYVLRGIKWFIKRARA